MVSSELSESNSDNISAIMRSLKIGDTLKVNIKMEKIGNDMAVKESGYSIKKAEPQNTSSVVEGKIRHVCPYAEIEDLLSIENILDTEVLTKMVKDASEIYERYKLEEKGLM
uniref:Translation initiation factor IF-2 n=1 Tax=Parastrongyloides trichosuri TaxID=131310 RepID=A0A0N4ZSA2_PARTI